jgi:hypothetical protein
VYFDKVRNTKFGQTAVCLINCETEHVDKQGSVLIKCETQRVDKQRCVLMNF